MQWWQLGVLTAGACLTMAPEIMLGPRLSVNGAAIFYMLGCAFVGPVAAIVMPIVAVSFDYLLHRYRTEAMISNIGIAALPNVVASALFAAWLPHGPLHGLEPLVLIGVAAIAWIAHLAVGVPAAALLGQISLRQALQEYGAVTASIVFSVALVGAIGAVYATSVEAGLTVAIALSASFLYTARQTVALRSRADKLQALNAARARWATALSRVEDRERRRLGEQIHDEALQDVLTARQDVQAAIGGDCSRLPMAQHALEEASRRLRAIVRALHPALSRSADLPVELAALADSAARRSKLALIVNVEPDMACDYSNVVLMAAREAITNVIKHARARTIWLSGRSEQENVVVEIADDGCGLDGDPTGSLEQNGHFGIVLMRDRIEAVGGTVRLANGSRGGLQVTVVVPRHQAQGTAAGSTERATSTHAEIL